MPFKKHDRVYSKRLETGGVVLDALKTGIYKVAIGNLSVECREDDLTPLKSWQVGGVKPKASKAQRGRAKGPARSRSVDLHGMNVDEALSLVERTLNEALMANLDSLEIIHGIGTGRLKSAVQRYLAATPTVKRFKLDDGNPGTTWAYF